MASTQSPISTLDIYPEVNITAGQTVTVTSILSDFVLVGATVQGTTGTIATIRKNGLTAAVATYAAGPPVANSCVLTNANTSFAATDALTIVISGATATRITLYVSFPNVYADALTTSIA